MAEMPLLMVPDEDQRQLASTAGQFFAEHSPIERVRALRDGADELGYSRALWGRIAELGYPALHLPEEHGGLGMSFFDLALVFTQAGRTLVPEPLLSQLFATEVLSLGGSDAQRDAWLAGIADGSVVVGLAFEEAGQRYARAARSTTAVASTGGYVLSGQKIQALDAHGADQLLVTAALDGVTQLFLVPRDATGLTVVRQHRLDGRNVARVSLDAVEVPSAAMLPGGADAFGVALDRATVALSAEMVGAADAVFHETVEYLKVRKQFGVPIGSFQALQHRAGRVYIALELCRSAVLAAARAVDERPAELARYASLAKAHANDALLLACDEAVQMHGGVGVTDECNVGFYLKRARAAAATFGDAAFHRDRFASFNGY